MSCAIAADGMGRLPGAAQGCNSERRFNRDDPSQAARDAEIVVTCHYNIAVDT